MINRRVVSCFFLIVFLFAVPFNIFASDVLLSWNSNEDADYYVIYYGTDSGEYFRNTQDIPAPANEYRITDLENTIWYFSVKAFNRFGNSSDFSDEAVHIPYYSPLEAEIESPCLHTVIIEGESVNFKGFVRGGAAPLIYTWSFGAGGPQGSSSRSPGNIVFENPGLYNVFFTVTDSNGASSSVSVLVTVEARYLDIVPVIEIVSPSDNATIFEGGSIVFEGHVSNGNAPYTYNWNFGTGTVPDSDEINPGVVFFNKAGSYVVTFTVRDADGDESSSSITVTVEDRFIDLQPVASVSQPASDISIVKGGSVTFSGTVTGGNAPFTYNWNFDDSGIPDSTMQNAGTRVFNVPGTYSVVYTVTDGDGDKDQFVRVVTVVEPDTFPSVSITSPSTHITVTEGQSVNFAASVSLGNEPFTHLWDFGESGITSKTVKDPGSFVFSKEGTFTITYTVTDNDGDVSSAVRVVTVAEPDTEPAVTITSPSGDITVPGGRSVLFTGSVYEGNAPFNHVWDFGSSGISQKNVKEPGSVTFTRSGTFKITYTVTDSDGDIGSASLYITVTSAAATGSEEEKKQETDPYINITDSIPGTKSTDKFTPPTSESIVNSSKERSTIKVTDNQFRHLLWLRTGWENYNIINGESRVATGDIDGDGKDEIIIGFSSENTEYPMPGGFFQVLDDNYTHLAWGRVEWADYNEQNGETWPVCGDIDGDGKDEIIVGLGRHGGGYVEVFSFANGKVVHKNWLRVQWPEYNEANGETRPACADINGDGIDDIVVGLGSLSGKSGLSGGKFEIFSMIDGQWNHMLWGEVDWPEYAEINGETWPACGDVNGDGKTDLVIGLGQGSEGHMVFFEFFDGLPHQTEWMQVAWPEYNDIYGETRPICGDVNGDGKDEVILGWSTMSGTGEPLHYFKIFSYDQNKNSWFNYSNTKSTAQIDIDSTPVKGSVAVDSKRIYTGIRAVKGELKTAEHEAHTSTGSGSGCFISSFF